jgi:hypothetical protein
MKKFRPLILIAAGVFLMLFGFFYLAIFAGVPYQDPPPEISASYALHTQIGFTIFFCGVGAFVFGAVAGIVRRFRMPVR